VEVAGVGGEGASTAYENKMGALIISGNFS
jgi:hypothetical protein